MAYATVKDVQALNRARKIGQGNNPTEDDVTTYLELTEAEINAILVNKGYAVPVSKEEAPQAFQLLRRLNALGAYMQMEEASANSVNLDRARKAYDEGMEDLKKAETVMDAPQNVQRAEARGPGLTTPQLKFVPGEVYDPNLLPGRSGPGTNPNAPYLARDLQF